MHQLFITNYFSPNTYTL